VKSKLALAAVVTVLAASSMWSWSADRQTVIRTETVAYGGRQYTLTADASGWSLWQGDTLRWRGRGTAPALPVSDAAASPSGELVEIAALPCPGDVFAGGQIHAWDLEGDLQPELVFGNWADTTYVYKAVGDNQLVQVHQLSNPVGSYYTELVCAGDGDSDGLAELVFSTGTSGVPRDLFFVESSGPALYPDTVVLVLPEESIGVNHLRMTDLDGDGLREYVGTSQGTHDNLLAIWENRADNTFARVFSWHPGDPSAVSGELAPGDVDGDGKGDIVVVTSVLLTDTVHLLECTGDDAYQEVWSVELPTDNAYWVTPGPDLDRDGKGDFVVTGGVGYPIATWSFLMYEADGDDSCRLAWSYQTQAAVIDGGCATGDLDGDGREELLGQVPGKTRVFRAAGDDDLALYWEHDGAVIGQGENRVVAPDLDRDGGGEAIWWTTSDPGTAVVYELVGAIFADGFEGGDTSAWSATVE